MLSSYPVGCPCANCTWTGSLVPSLLQGGAEAEVASMHRAWFRCPRCQGDWEVRITNDRVIAMPAVECGSAFRDAVSSDPGRAVAFDVDAVSLARLRETLPGWEIDAVDGATPESLTDHWDPAEADLLVVDSNGNLAELLALCRFLSEYTRDSTDNRKDRAELLGSREERPASRAGAPILVLVHPGQEKIVGAALEAGARSCLVLPVHTKSVASMLVHARAGNQPGRHTLNLDRSQVEDPWRDDGGQG
jgi:hypothetical protein